MLQHALRAAGAAGVACLAAATLTAALPTFWRVSTEAEFLEGEVENLSVDRFGRVTLGPTTAAIHESPSPFLWAMTTAPDGSVFAGSGNEGQVYRIDPQGRASVHFDAEELEVHALALAPGGALYAGTSPDGRIYRIDAGGTATPFFDPPDRYIWSLAVDGSGTVFAATGDKGVIYRITPDGRGAPFYETRATHAISLAFDAQGRLLAGTESPGRVFRIDAAGRAFVLLDSPFNEIRALRVDPQGVIYAAALRGGGGQPAPPRPPEPAPPAAAPVASVSTEITGITVVAEAQTGAGSAAPAPARQTGGGPATGALYRIQPDGGWDIVWESREDSPYDIVFEPDGSLLLATGDEGRIFRLAGDPVQSTLVARATARQVTSLTRARGGDVLVATSNPGKILRLSSARAGRGTYTSDVRDAQAVASWGTISWQAVVPAGAAVEIATRSGNTRTPDDTWSEWSAPYSDATGSAMTSPRARYLQWRAQLADGSGGAPVLTSVTAAYLPRNARPRVTSITIHPPGTVFQRPFPADPEIAGFEGDTPERRLQNQQAGNAAGQPQLGRRAYQKGLLTFVWRAEDENRDELRYAVKYRREGETAWKTLRDDLVDSILVWDTTSVPNGRYVVRIDASDAPSNSPDTALVGWTESTTFEIDNTPPSITVQSARRENGRLTVAFEVRDEDSAILKADYSLDGDRWQTIYPRDGIADSRTEQFQVVLEGEAAARGVILRATDTLNNTASVRGEAPAESGRR